MAQQAASREAAAVGALYVQQRSGRQPRRQITAAGQE